jgi:hypothetical protein
MLKDLVEKVISIGFSTSISSLLLLQCPLFGQKSRLIVLARGDKEWILLTPRFSLYQSFPMLFSAQSMDRQLRHILALSGQFFDDLSNGLTREY